MNILMPQLGETVAEGKITTWYKSVGDTVAAGDSLFEIETDKTSMEVPSTVAGVLWEVRVAAGATVPVGAVVAVLGSAAAPAAAGGAGTAAAAASGVAGVGNAARAAGRPADPYQAVRTPERHYGPATLPNGIKVTPVARRLAAEAGVDLAGLSGSGPHGHIVARDVQAAAGGNAAGAAPASAGAAIAAGGAAAQIKSLFAGVPFEQLALDGMRRTIARRLLEAKQSIPHFYLSGDIALDRMIALRSEFNEQAGGGSKLSINDFIIKAAALALQRVPESNAAWAEDSILRFKRSDVAVAVAVEGGLYTPVIRGAESKSISALSREMKSLAERALARALRPDDYQGGAITISNLGMYGVRSFAAIVNPPQAVILAVGAAERRPTEAHDGSVRFGTAMTLTLSCDHRVIDGVVGARLLAALKALLESPLLLFA